MTKGSILIYKTYNFIRKDPVIDDIRGMIEDSPNSIGQIAADAGVADHTIRAWLYGKTRKPQSASIEAVGRACGFRRKWVKAGDLDVQARLDSAKAGKILPRRKVTEPQAAE